MDRTLPCEIPNACAISSAGICLPEYTRIVNFLHNSSSRGGVPVSFQTRLYLLKTFYFVQFRPSRIDDAEDLYKSANSHCVFPCMFTFYVPKLLHGTHFRKKHAMYEIQYPFPE